MLDLVCAAQPDPELLLQSQLACLIRHAGCGLPPGPNGLLGAAEGISYLVVAGLILWSFGSWVRRRQGLVAGGCCPPDPQESPMSMALFWLRNTSGLWWTSEVVACTCWCAPRVPDTRMDIASFTMLGQPSGGGCTPQSAVCLSLCAFTCSCHWPHVFMRSCAQSMLGPQLWLAPQQ